jgi:hypothetical protein
MVAPVHIFSNLSWLIIQNLDTIRNFCLIKPRKNKFCIRRVCAKNSFWGQIASVLDRTQNFCASDLDKEPHCKIFLSQSREDDEIFGKHKTKRQGTFITLPDHKGTYIIAQWATNLILPYVNARWTTSMQHCTAICCYSWALQSLTRDTSLCKENMTATKHNRTSDKENIHFVYMVINRDSNEAPPFPCFGLQQ